MGRKKKVNIDKLVKVKNIRAIDVNGIIFSYDNPSDFVEAWPGFKLWFEVASKNNVPVIS